MSLLDQSIQRGRPDKVLYEMVDEQLTSIEVELLLRPFLEPLQGTGLGEGDIHLVTTPGGEPIKVSFAGESNKITHMVITGCTGKGKSCLQALIAIDAASRSPTLLLDVNKFFRTILALHERYTFIHWSQLRLNPFDVPEGVSAGQLDNVMCDELAKNFGLEFGGLLLRQTVNDLREKGTPNLPWILATLERQRFTGSWNMGRYRDSCCLVLRRLLAATNELFQCSEGMSIKKLVESNLVLELDGLLVSEQAFLTRLFFEYVHLLSLVKDEARIPN